MSFNTSYSSDGLQKIHFVDNNESMVRAIQETFRQKVPSTLLTTTGNSESLGNAHADGENKPPTFKNSFHSDIPPSNAYTIVNVSDTLQIKIYIGNITDITSDVIVCPQDIYCSSGDETAIDIFRKLPGYSKSKISDGILKYGEVLPMSLQKKSPWKMIIHAVTPQYDFEYSKDAGKFGATLKDMIQHIIKAAEEAECASIAIPFLGKGKEIYISPFAVFKKKIGQVIFLTGFSKEKINSVIEMVKMAGDWLPKGYPY